MNEEEMDVEIVQVNGKQYKRVKNDEGEFWCIRTIAEHTKVNYRTIYYHLNKGVELGIFNLKEIRDVKGDFSWGSGVKQVIFQLGANAQPKGSKEVATNFSNTPTR